MSTTFWDLCSDILQEIFSYFSIDQVFYSFYPDVFPSLSNIIYESRMKFPLCLTNDDMLNATLFSLIDKHQIIALRLTAVQIGLIEFLDIQSITLVDVRMNMTLLTELSALPLLKRVILIYSHNESKLNEAFLSYIFCLPYLKYLELDFHGSYLNIPQISKKHVCSIKELVLRTPCSWNNLQELIGHLLHLRILRVMINVHGNGNNNVPHQFGLIPPIISNASFPSIEIFDLTWYTIEMKNILAFVRQMPNLKQLCLSGITNKNALQSNIWKELLNVVCPNLQLLNVKMLIWIQEGVEEIKNNFDTDFFFKQTQFYLTFSTHERELLQFNGKFRR
ncbi:unnamed protein product [Rotaria sp. Silwood1]|nr:unnamed protein product [Rotaria sp. Silwood1]